MDVKIIEEIGPDIVTLEEVKGHLRLEHSDEDAYITSLIKVATEYCENFTGRFIKQKTVEIILDNFPNKVLKLPITSVIDINSIYYTNSKGEEVHIEPSNYVKVLGTEPPIVVHKDIWPKDVINIPGKVRVEVKVGYETVPQSIKQAILLLCSHFNENREAVNKKGEFKELPFSISALLYPYKVFRW
ncbi:head-tail connector protein [Caloranaerobacter ferrireducens]|uniref:head-tail connector protein n=1 Tax=Caloranaerobacter ferrireducens TaxID=1323370 RepID=UPI00084D35FD|nr:head-tail connector protein [Caloranaerobacter ferrireducens]